jgi:RNA polymerase sigma-70 factor (ECF subfamily)
MVGDGEDAEEVTERVLEQVVRRAFAPPEGTSRVIRLDDMVMQAVSDIRRDRDARCGRVLSDTMSSGSDDGTCALPPPAACRDGGASGGELLALFDTAVDGLPARYREVFLLADVEGVPPARIRDLLCLSPRAYDARLHQARLLMRDALSLHLRP